MSYTKIIEKVQELLTNNTEWEARYEKYMANYEKFNTSGKKVFLTAQKQFLVPTHFALYMPISLVNDCNSRTIFFELRFHGQSVALIRVHWRKGQFNKNVELFIKKSETVYNALCELQLTDFAEKFKELWKKCVSWNSSSEAKSFREIYLKLERELKNNPTVKLKGQPEHEMESELLRIFSEKSTTKKDISYIQPVKIPYTKARFQMPTPITASEAKNGADKIKYSGENGGGIDILARVGRGSHATLAILELKDQNIKSEPPERAINQAIAYATFIRELLRSEIGQKWWKFFGFSGNLPNTLKLKAIIVMPNENNPSKSFAKTSLGFNDGTNDAIELGYIYRDPLECDF